jgi:hypothetical protein
MRLPERKIQNNPTLIYGQIVSLYFEDLVKAQDAQERYCIGGLQKPSGPTATPAVQAFASTTTRATTCWSFAYARLVCLDRPVLGKMVVMVQLQ